MLEHQLVLAGANHKSAPIWLRERFHCELDQIKYREPTARLKEHAGNGDGETFDLLVRELFAINQENVR